MYVSAHSIGLAMTRDDSSVKCYLGDTGLLVSLAFSENELASMDLYRKIIAGRLAVNEGMIHENLVSQMLTAAGRSLYFYSHYSEDKHRNDIEVDFLLSNDSPANMKIVPIEVKSSKNYTTSSYDAFKRRFGKRVGASVIVHPKGFSRNEGGVKVPTYMFFCVAEGMAT